MLLKLLLVVHSFERADLKILENAKIWHLDVTDKFHMFGLFF